MRIALDATPLTASPGGIARYTCELSRALATCFPEDDYWLVSDQPFRLPERAPANLRRGAAPVRLWQRRWWSAGLIAELARRRIEVFHGTDFAVPYLPVRPAVMTLHDLSPWRNRIRHPGSRRVRRRTPLLLRLGLATMIVTPTEAIRREAIARFRIPPERIVAVPLAAAPVFRPVPAEPAPDPYFLYAGVIEPRKNLNIVVEAWRELRRSAPVILVLAGRRRADAPEIRPEPGVELVGEVPDDRLAWLYSNALAFLYPSLYEGFGLPVLEAMACGAPVIISRDPALVEVAGDAALQLDAGDPRQWLAAMKLAFENPEWRARQRSRSLERARGFSWSLTARLTRDVYVEAKRRFEA